MLNRLGERLTVVAHRVVPDPFVLAVVLTVVTLLGALLYSGFDAPLVLETWIEGRGAGRGFWNFLGFGMQMCLILVTGHALASSPPMDAVLSRLSSRVTTAGGAIALVSATSMALGLLNWGLGLIGGALLARRVGERARRERIPVAYPLLVAAGYMGMLVWHGGLSGSAPTKVTLESDVVQLLGSELAGRLGTLGLGRTIGSWQNLGVAVGSLFVIPWVLIRLNPGSRPEGDLPPEEAMSADLPPPRTPAERLGNSRLLTVIIVGLGFAALTLWLVRRGVGRLDPNVINFGFLFAGLMLHGSVVAYGRAIADATRGCAGIILQFPFYAGIAGVLDGLGLVAQLGSLLSSVGSEWLPLVSFYSAGLVNLLVPSGGGQWGVQGPVLMQAALDTGVDPARIVMALSYGDQWTNMLQPFWALPLLAVTGVRARDILGYTAVVLLVSQVLFIAGLYF